MTTDRRGLPTKYRGWTFRSRLEARWAVFFDGLGTRWEYEPDGFKLQSGLYVPDFYLPDVGWWVEVRPDLDTALDGLALAKELSTFTEQPVLLTFKCSRQPTR